MIAAFAAGLGQYSMFDMQVARFVLNVRRAAAERLAFAPEDGRLGALIGVEVSCVSRSSVRS
jgi:hypothetical protein